MIASKLSTKPNRTKRLTTSQVISPCIFQLFRTIERDEGTESSVNRGRNKERAAKREKKPEEHERNTRQRVRKSECHCRNLRTLTSSWLVPPSSSWSQPSSPLSLPFFFLIVFSLSLSLSLSLVLALSPARFASNPLLYLFRLFFSPATSIPPFLFPSFVFPPREFQVFCDNSRAVRYSTDIQSAMIELQRSSEASVSAI